jgi:uncharacterized protein
MTRILFWLALAFLVVAAIRSKLRGAARDQRPRGEPRREADRAAAAARAAAQASLAEPESMLCCTHCGVHYPASENVRLDGRDYCSQAHAQLPAH